MSKNFIDEDRGNDIVLESQAMVISDGAAKVDETKMAKIVQLIEVDYFVGLVQVTFGVELVVKKPFGNFKELDSAVVTLVA